MRGKIIIELCPSSRSHCFNCSELIPKESYRVRESYGSGRFRHEDKYCKVCGKQFLLVTIIELHKGIEQLET